MAASKIPVGNGLWTVLSPRLCWDNIQGNTRSITPGLLQYLVPMPVAHNYLISYYRYSQNLNFNPFKAHIYDLRLQLILIFLCFFFLFHSNPVSDPEPDCSFPSFSYCHLFSCLPPVLPLKLFVCSVVNHTSEMTARDIKTAGHGISLVHCLN